VCIELSINMQDTPICMLRMPAINLLLLPYILFGCSNDLHGALLLKKQHCVLETWRSKFNKSVKCGQVDGCVDPDVIADNFVPHFRKAFTHNNPVKAESKGRIFSSAW